VGEQRREMINCPILELNLFSTLLRLPSTLLFLFALLSRRGCLASDSALEIRR
jgi:hypothetical protein